MIPIIPSDMIFMCSKKESTAQRNAVTMEGREFLVRVEEGNWREISEDLVPVEEGMRWECLRCGWCCTRDWRIDISWKEYHRLKDLLPVDRVIFDETANAHYPYFLLRGKCAQYDEAAHACRIYPRRCYICRSFPFYLHPGKRLYVSKLCKGMGKGDLIEIGEKIDGLLRWRGSAGFDVSGY